MTLLSIYIYDIWAAITIILGIALGIGLIIGCSQKGSHNSGGIHFWDSDISDGSDGYSDSPDGGSD